MSKMCTHENRTEMHTVGGSLFANCLRCGAMWKQWLTSSSVTLVANPSDAPTSHKAWNEWVERNDLDVKKFFAIEPDMPEYLKVYIRKKNAAYKAELIAKHGPYYKHAAELPVKHVSSLADDNVRVFRDV